MQIQTDIALNSAVDVPQFLAGFFYEMTNENHLEEIEACAQGTEILGKEIETSIAELKTGGLDADLQAVLNFGLVALQVPNALQTCMNTKDDMAALKEWASIFSDTEKLIKKVSKSSALHHHEFQDDVSVLKQDAVAGLWFTTGEDVADLLTLALGPITPEYPTVYGNFDTEAKAVASFIEGFLFRLTGDTKLTNVEGCYKGTKKVVDDLEAILAAISASEYRQTATDVAAIITDILADLDTCKAITTDVASVKTWAVSMKSPLYDLEVVGENYLLHREVINDDVTQELAAWKDGNFYQAGVKTADALATLLGPVEPVEPKIYTVSSTEDEVKHAATYVAGLLFRLTGDAHLEETQACYDGTMKVVHDFEDILGAFHNSQYVKTANDVSAIITDILADVTTCKNVTKDVESIQEWIAKVKKPLTFAEDTGRNYLNNRDGINKDIASEEANWAKGDYWQSGMDTADALALLFGPSTPAKPEEKTMMVASNDAEDDAMHAATYVAGLLFRLTGEAHLDETTACYEGTMQVVDDFEEILDSFSRSQYLQTANDVSAIISDILEDVSNCENISDEVTAIDEWLAKLKQPLSFAEETGKNYYNYYNAINADIASEEDQWNKGNYYQSGMDTADALALLFGLTEPIKPEEKPEEKTAMVTFDKDAAEKDAEDAAKFVAGFLYGVTDDKHLEEIKKCY
jgi:hypothetical protein